RMYAVYPERKLEPDTTIVSESSKHDPCSPLLSGVPHHLHGDDLDNRASLSPSYAYGTRCKHSGKDTVKQGWIVSSRQLRDTTPLGSIGALWMPVPEGGEAVCTRCLPYVLDACHGHRINLSLGADWSAITIRCVTALAGDPCPPLGRSRPTRPATAPVSDPVVQRC